MARRSFMTEHEKFRRDVRGQRKRMRMIPKTSNMKLLRAAYIQPKDLSSPAHTPVPGNNKPTNGGRDFLFRELDCAVIHMLHRMKAHQPSARARGVFWEGDLRCPNAGF